MSERAPRPRPPKKTGTIEFRVAVEDKDAFLDACEEAGRPASGVLREAMAHFVRHGRIAPSRWSRLMPNSVIAAGLALAFAVQSADRLPGADRPYAIAEFDYYDLNSDGRITLHEYLRASGTVRELAGNSRTPRQAERTGRVFGLFAAYNAGPAHMLFAHPDRVSDECWRAVEDQQLIANTRHFQRMDADNDGVVTPEEFGRYRLEATRRAFSSAWDLTGDGLITPVDLELRTQRFSAFQTETPQREEQLLDPDTFNEDTPDHVRVCTPEFVQLARMEPEAAPAGRDANTLMQSASVLEHFDLDGDGVVTFEEYATVMERNWSRP
ncbi:MAG: EF-hand domain-containing protein [Glycocaulis sp.]